MPFTDEELAKLAQQRENILSKKTPGGPEQPENREEEPAPIQPHVVNNKSVEVNPEENQP